MKKTTLLWLCCSLLAWGRVAAQSAPPSDSVRQYLDQMFAPVDKTQVPTPYLEEYGFRFAPLRLFAGALQDSNRTTATLWRQLYATVLSGNINGANALPLLPALNTALQTQVAASAAIPLLVQRLDYATLRPDAISAGLLTGQNEQLYDVPGRAQSPYRVRTLFAAAPARNSVPTGDVSFIFTQALYVQQGGGSLHSFSLDFGDGRGYLPANWAEPVSASYTTAGTKRVKVRVTYTNSIFEPAAKDGSGSKVGPPPTGYVSYESHFDLEVLEAAPVGGAARYTTDSLARTFFPAVMGVHSGGKVYVRFGGAPGSRTQITKPLIVVEGYDPSSIAPEVQDNYSIQSFLNAIAARPFNTGRTLFNSLEDYNPVTDSYGVNGYDIIFIDFNNGTDDIRRNAALFEEVVRWVNQVKAGGITGGQRNVVLGISMGGLVARYGLAEMVKNPQVANNNPHTRLLLTHDAPHRGANTPLGLQALTRQAAGSLAGQFIRVYNSLGVPVFFPKLALFPDLQQADELLDAPATRQLLVVRATRSLVGPLASFGHEYNSFLDGDYRTMITPTPGQTFPYEFKATSLGSQCGFATLAPHSELARVAGAGYLNLPTPSTALHTEIVVNAMPNPGQVERISGLRLWQQVRVLFFSRKIYLTRLDYQAPADNPIAWDGLPGGTQRINGQLTLAPGSSGFGVQFPFASFGYGYSVALANSFCFVPTASALDVPVIDNVTTRSSYISNVTTGPSQPLALGFIAQAPFADFRTGLTNFNFEHPRFPGRQAQWLFNEMEGNTLANVPLTCASECTLYPMVPIEGPDNICPGSTGETFTVTPPFGGVTSWTASPAGLVTLPPNTAGATSTVVAPASGGASGLVTLTAFLSNGCYSTTATRQIAVGQGYVSISGASATGQEWCAEPTATFAIAESYGVKDTYTWQVSDGYIDSGQGTPQITLAGLPYQHYQLQLSVSVDSNCPGAPPVERSVYQGYYIQHPITKSDCPYLKTGNRAASPHTAALYPNPARETVDVQVTNATAAHPVTVRLFDGYGRPRAEQTSTGAASVRLATDKLPAGLYFVHVLRGAEVLSRQQLRIEK